MVHNWKREDDILTFWLYDRLCGKGGEIEQKCGNAVADIIGVKGSTLKMRIDNFAYLDKQKGLCNAAQQTREVFAAFFVKKAALKQEAKVIVEAVPGFNYQKAILKQLFA